jgi:LytS/YehU family sensor histidine kinase
LRVEIQVDDSALGIPIPVLSIQPLVENAIKHGVSQRIEPGHVGIRVSHSNDHLHVTVENSSSGLNTESRSTGVGLENVRRRLEICYGSGAFLQLRFHPRDTLVELSIPLAHVSVP